MALKKKSFLFFLLLCLGNVDLGLCADRIAVATKVMGTVEYERGRDGFKDLKPGSILEDGDRIRTGKNGFVAIIFIDDKSALKVKENTEIVVEGKRSQNAISKKINLNGGTLRALVSPQRKGEFIIQTAVSVASVKGTDFWIISNVQTGDQLIGLKGLITFINMISGDSIDISSGFTGLSSSDGSIQSYITDPNTIPVDPTGDSDSPTRLEIEFKDPSGKKKVLIIEYK